jgi:hypothetical protein
VLREMRAASCDAVCPVDLDAALRWLEEWGILQGKAGCSTMRAGSQAARLLALTDIEEAQAGLA